jgi:hypothetical protein
MVRQNWKDAYAALRARTGSVDGEQLALASQLKLRLSSRLPATVAAVLIRERLAGPLRAAPPTEPSHGQLEYLSDVLEWLEIRRPTPTDTQQQVSAWLEVLELRRAAKALRDLRPAPGDIVIRITQPEEPGEVVSISDRDGRINIAGPGGRGLRPHEIQIEARANDSSREASDARRLAANRAALRSGTDDMPSQEKIAHLRPHRVTGSLEPSVLVNLERTVDDARDERPIQAFIQRYPQVLAALCGPTSLGTYVRSQPSLGGQLYPDFAIAVVDSAGVHWTLVELESPRVAAGLKDGQLSQKARTAVQQVLSWREWLIDNLAAARSSGQHGLGLTDIRPESPGIVLIGRRSSTRPVSPLAQHRLSETQQVTLHSYDWLLDALRTRRGQPGGVLDRSSSSL